MEESDSISAAGAYVVQIMRVHGMKAQPIRGVTPVQLMQGASAASEFASRRHAKSGGGAPGACCQAASASVQHPDAFLFNAAIWSALGGPSVAFAELGA